MNLKRVLLITIPGLFALAAAIAWAVTPATVREGGSALKIVVDESPDTAHQTGDIRILAVDEAHNVHAAALLTTEPTSRVDWTARDGDRTEGASETETAKATAWDIAWTIAHPGVPVPAQVQIPTPDLNGPSLGLSSTLAYIDALTDGDLTGGQLVAATGVINADGTVSAIGKVDVKARTARDVGVKVLLVPADNADTARAAVAQDDRGMRIVAVGNIAQAVRELCNDGGQAAEVCPNP